MKLIPSVEIIFGKAIHLVYKNFETQSKKKKIYPFLFSKTQTQPHKREQ